MIEDLQKIVLLDTEFSTVWLYPKERVVHHQFKKFIFGEDFRKTLNTGLEAFNNKLADKWMSDDRENAALSQADTSWGEQVWFPAVLAAGWKYWAILVPKKAIGKMNIKGVIEHFSQGGVKVQIFDDPEKGMEWLISQK
jgi:hypothetical protein